MDPLAWIDDELGALEAAGLSRSRPRALRRAGPRVEIDGRSVLNLSSNDYLSLAGVERGVDGPSGASASRLVCGELEVHRRLERALAEWLGAEEALLFNSGYAANVGAISALSTAGTVVLSDALNHASIIDGCRLGRGRTVVFPHRDVAAVDRALSEAPERRRLVVTDGYFSMDGDLAPLAKLRSVCDRHGAALYVDEAHALGVWGREGRGACEAAGVPADVRMGTLGKAFGAGGAFVVSSSRVAHWLWNRARSFSFSTGLPPVVAELGLRALPLVRDGARTAALHANCDAFRGALSAAGIVVPSASEGPIVPLLLRSPDRAVRVSRALLDRGILAQPIRPPTVPRETSRLRLTVQAGHRAEELIDAAGHIAEVLR